MHVPTTLTFVSYETCDIEKRIFQMREDFEKHFNRKIEKQQGGLRRGREGREPERISLMNLSCPSLV